MAKRRCLIDTSILVFSDREALKGNLLHVTVSGATNGWLL